MPGRSPVAAFLWAQLELNHWKAAMSLDSCAFQKHMYSKDHHSKCRKMLEEKNLLKPHIILQSTTSARIRAQLWPTFPFLLHRSKRKYREVSSVNIIPQCTVSFFCLGKTQTSGIKVNNKSTFRNKYVLQSQHYFICFWKECYEFSNSQEKFDMA